MKKLLFGTAGIPTRTEGPTEAGIADVRKMGLGAMELEFVRSVYVTEKKTEVISRLICIAFLIVIEFNLLNYHHVENSVNFDISL